MESRLTSLLTVVSIAITVLVGTYLGVGPGPSLALSVITLLALAGWLRFSASEISARSKAVAPYILVVVLLLALNTCRYWAGYAATIGADWHSFFSSGFKLTDTHWFVFLVVCPISLLLLGGYFLSRGTPLGSFMAWWAFLYAIGESFVQLALSLDLKRRGGPDYHLGDLLSLVLLAIAATGCLRLTETKEATEMDLAAKPGLTHRQMNLWTLLLVSLVVIYGTSLYLQAGLLPVGVIVASMMGGLVGWRRTTALCPADPHRVVPLYLLMLAFFYFHVGEEALTSFNQGIAALTGTAWPDREFTFFIGLIGPAIWVFGGFSLWLRQPFGNFLLWFMIVGMILGEPTHFLVFPIIRMYQTGEPYQYFSGMFTALFAMVPAILALVVIRRDQKTRSSTLAGAFAR